MESLIRNVVEPFFETILKRLTELDKKIINVDTKITKMENEIMVLGCKIDSNISASCLHTSNCISSCIMESID